MMLLMVKEESGEENDPIHAPETEEEQKLILCGRREP